MRYCPFCQRINIGRPQICNYCGHTWYVRLCPRGHVNVADSQFCAECGSADLSDTAGPRPWWIWLIKVIPLCVLLVLILSIFSAEIDPSGFLNHVLPLFVPIFLLFIGYSLVMNMLPGPVRRLVQSMIRPIKKGCMICLGWLWGKIKNLFI